MINATAQPEISSAIDVMVDRCKAIGLPCWRLDGRGVVAGMPAGWGPAEDWLRAPVFGVAPNPTTIFPLGMLLLIARRVPLHLLVIPVLWSLIGGATAWLLNVPGDLALPLAGVSTVWLVLWKNRRMAVEARYLQGDNRINLRRNHSRLGCYFI